MKQSLIFIAAAIIVLSCKQKLTHREKINLDSTGKRVLNVSPPDSVYTVTIDTGHFRSLGKKRRYLNLSKGTIEWFAEIVMQTDSFKTYRQNGKWHIENPAASLEMLYQVMKQKDSIESVPFVIISPTDTFRIYYRRDIVRIVNSDPDLIQL